MSTSVAALPEDEFAPTEAIPLNPQRRRLEALDILRGLLMILMALDHTRDFFSSVHSINPTDPLHSWPALFFTRWITHLCAPGFVALAGASIYLQRTRGKSRSALTRFLLTRGLWLIFIEITVIGFAWSFYEPFIFLQVIWAIGVCMIVLSVLQWLPTAAVGLIGAAILLFHNLLDPVTAAAFGRYAWLWQILHTGGLLTVHRQPIAFIFYPVLPWIGIMCVGYAFGPLANSSGTPAQRHRATAGLAALFLAVFAVLRLTNVYGDPYRFQHLAGFSHTAMSFFQVQKYPPSLDYALATFAVLLLLYTFFDMLVSRGLLPRVRGVVEVYGRVPFFYYVQHVYLIHAAALVAAAAAGANWRVYASPAIGSSSFPPVGHNLPAVYAIWFCIVAALYPGCRWFANLRARRRNWWLSYL